MTIVLLIPIALAGTLSQPFADDASVAAVLQAACGAFVAEPFGPDASISGERCEGLVFHDEGRFALDLSAGDLRLTRPTASEPGVLEDVARRDSSWLEELGFDPSEFDNVVARDIKIQTDDGDSTPTTIYGGTITFIDRAIGDSVVPGNRAVVVRDATGEVALVTAFWPAFDDVTVVTAHGPVYDESTYAELLGVKTADVLRIFPALDIDGVTEGCVGTARGVVAVVYRVAGPDGSNAGVARYFRDTTVLAVGGEP